MRSAVLRRLLGVFVGATAFVGVHAVQDWSGFEDQYLQRVCDWPMRMLDRYYEGEVMPLRVETDVPWLVRFAVSCAAPLAGAVIAYQVVARAAPRPKDVETRCRSCGYILKGLSCPRCPECGTVFDAQILVRPARVPDANLRWFLRPVPRWCVALAAVAVAGVCVTASDVPSLSRDLKLAAWLALLIVVSLDAGARLAARRVARRRRWRSERVRDMSCDRRIATVLTCFVAGILSVATDWPLRTRFLLSRPALERAVADISRGTSNTKRLCYLGLFRIRDVYADPSGANVIYFELDHDFANYVGLVYRPSGSQQGKSLDARWSVESW